MRHSPCNAVRREGQLRPLTASGISEGFNSQRPFEVNHRQIGRQPPDFIDEGIFGNCKGVNLRTKTNNALRSSPGCRPAHHSPYPPRPNLRRYRSALPLSPSPSRRNLKTSIKFWRAPIFSLLCLQSSTGLRPAPPPPTFHRCHLSKISSPNLIFLAKERRMH